MATYTVKSRASLYLDSCSIHAVDYFYSVVRLGKYGLRKVLPNFGISHIKCGYKFNIPRFYSAQVVCGQSYRINAIVTGICMIMFTIIVPGSLDKGRGTVSHTCHRDLDLSSHYNLHLKAA